MASATWFVAVALSVFGGSLRQLMIDKVGTSILLHFFLSGAFSLLAMILLMFVLAFIYRVAQPSTATWISTLPGAAVATALWWGANVLFGFYVRKTQYGPIYGGLAAVIGLLAWMELSVMLVFVGAAWNAESVCAPSSNKYAES